MSGDLRRVAGRCCADGHQPDHSSPTRKESGRRQHHRTLVIRILGQSGTTAALIIPRATPSPYPLATLDTTKAMLVSAVSESVTGVESGLVKIAGADWAFATCEKTPFPGTPDPAHICLKNGFNPSLRYELQYTVKDPLVLSIGFAATRDLNAFVR